MSGTRRAAGAVAKVVAPEAAVAAKAAGKAGGGKAAGADPRKTAPGSKAAQQREAVEQIKANRAPEPDGHGGQDHEQQQQQDGGGGRFAPFAGMQAPATGGGFALGLIGWALFRAYIGNPGQPGGMAGVKRLVLAKAFNKTSGGGAGK